MVENLVSMLNRKKYHLCEGNFPVRRIYVNKVNYETTLLLSATHMGDGKAVRIKRIRSMKTGEESKYHGEEKFTCSTPASYVAHLL